MGIDAGSIYSDVRVNTAKLSSDMRQVTTQFDNLTNKNKASALATQQAWGSSFNSIKIAAIASMAAITMTMKSAMTVANGFEQSLANVKSVAGATNAEFALLQKAAIDAGESTRFTASQAADAMYSLASAGLDAADSIRTLDGVLLLAGATGSNLAATSSMLVATLKQFQLETNESTRVSNVYAAAIANSMATMDKLTASMSYVGPVAGALNISLEDTVSILSQLYDAGFAGEKSGRALKTIFSSLASETSATSKALTNLGINYKDLNPEINNFADIVQVLNDRALSTGEVMSAFGEIAGPQMLTLLKSGSSAITQMTKDITGTDAAAKQYAIQNDTMSGSLDKFKSAIESSAIKLQQTFAPALKAAIDKVTELVVQFNKLPSFIKSFVSIMIIAIPTIIAGTVAFTGLSAAIAAAGGALAILNAPLLITVGAIAAVGTGVAGVAKHIKDVKLEKFEDLSNELEVTVDTLDAVSKSLGDIEKYKTFAQLAEQAKWGYTEMKRFSNWLITSTSNIDDFNKGLDLQAKKYNLTREQIVRLGIASGIITDERLSAMKSEINLIDENAKAKELQEKAERDRATKNEKRFKQEQAISKKTIELAALNSDELTKANDKYIEELSAIEKKKELGLLTDKEYNNKRIEANNTLLDSLLAIDDAVVPEDINKAIIETSQSIIDIAKANASLQKEEEALKKTESERKQELLEIKKATDSVLTTSIQYTRQSENLGATTGQLMELEKQRALDNITYSKADVEAKKIATEAINDYYVNLKNQNVIDYIDTYNSKIEQIGATSKELRNIQRINAIQAIFNMGLETDAAVELLDKTKEYYDLLDREAEGETTQKIADKIKEAQEGIKDSLLSSLGNLSSLFSAMSNSAINAIDAELKAKLKADGLAEKSTLEKLKTEDEANKKAQSEIINSYDERIAKLREVGDFAGAEAQERAKQSQIDSDNEVNKANEDAIKKEEITKEYEAKKAQIKYKYDMASWYANLASAVANNANAILKTMATYGYTPWGIGLAAAQGVVGGVQVAAVSAAKPKPVALATGGVVLPSVDGTLTRQAENGFGELSLNAGPSGEALLNSFAERIARQIGSSTSQIVVYSTLEVDGRKVAESVAKEFKNGNVRYK